METESGLTRKCHIDHIRDNESVQSTENELVEGIESDSDGHSPSLSTETTSDAENISEETTTPRYPSRTQIPPDRYM